MIGVYINCARYPFLDWIISKDKRYETRTRNMLGTLIGQRVALVETGKGKPTVKAMATIAAVQTVDHSSNAMRDAAMITGTIYDIPEDSTKLFYSLTHVKPVEPYTLPANKKNHGRAYTEF